MAPRKTIDPKWKKKFDRQDKFDSIVMVTLPVSVVVIIILLVIVTNLDTVSDFFYYW